MKIEKEINVRTGYSKEDIKELKEDFDDDELEEFFHAEKIYKAFSILFEKMAGVEFSDILDCKARRII